MKADHQPAEEHGPTDRPPGSQHRFDHWQPLERQPDRLEHAPSDREWPPRCDASNRLRGGKGQDTVRLPPGTYQIRDTRISQGDLYLSVSGINILEGLNGGRFRFAPGTLSVNSAGIASFLPLAAPL